MNCSAKKILLIEDDHDLSDVLRIRLEKSGFQVVTLFDGTEAVQVAQIEKPDMILLDIFMPETDGFTTLKTLKAERRQEPGMKVPVSEIPTIVMTGKAPMMEDMARFEGAVEFITKPIDVDHLMRRIGEILKQGSAQ